jgi:hypothetical protein
MPSASEKYLPAPTVSIEFHYKPEGAMRPYDETENTDTLYWQSGSFLPIPNVGDSVSFDSWKQTGPGDTDGEDYVVIRKVISRHFFVHQSHVNVYFVVTDISAKELGARIKE